MVKASETLHPGRREGEGKGRRWARGSSATPRHLCLWPRDLLGDHLWGCWSRGRAGAAHLPRFSWVMTEGGGLTLSVPPGQKLLVIQVTFSSTTCTWEGGRDRAPVSRLMPLAFHSCPPEREAGLRRSSDPPRGHGGFLPSRRAQRTCHWPPPSYAQPGLPVLRAAPFQARQAGQECPGLTPRHASSLPLRPPRGTCSWC